MNMDDRKSGRWIGLLVSGALVMGACSSSSAETSSADELDPSPSALALEDTTSSAEVSAPVEEAAFDIAEFSSLADLESVELTPEIFELLKTNEASRAAVIAEMGAQGLDAVQSECFLDHVSPGLFIAFGTSEQPDDAQFGELLGLLDTCEIAFGS